MITKDKIKQTILEVVKNIVEINKKSSLGYNLQSGGVLGQVATKLNVVHNITYERMILSEFQNLIHMGHFAWGHDLANPSQPFFHITEQGNKSLENISRDPANPEGYLLFIEKNSQLTDIEKSYLYEAINTFNSRHYKSAAVMIGAVAECFILKLREALIKKQQKHPKELKDWKVKTIFKGIKIMLDNQTSKMPNNLLDEYNAYWPALNEQIRRTKNDAGHPENISFFTYEDVHASLLMLPNIAKLTNHLMSFIEDNFT